MSFPNPYLSLHAKIVALLKGRADFYNPTPIPIDASSTRTLVFPKNLIDYTDTGLGRDPGSARSNSNDADYPACWIEEEQQSDAGPLAINNTFGKCNYNVQADVVFSVVIVGPDTRMTVVSNLRWAAEQAFRAFGPLMGLGSVGLSQWRMNSQMKITDQLIIAGQNVMGPDDAAKPRRYCKIALAAHFVNNVTALTA